MNFTLRRAAAYVLDGVGWVFTTFATAFMVVATAAKDAAARLKR